MEYNPMTFGLSHSEIHIPRNIDYIIFLIQIVVLLRGACYIILSVFCWNPSIKLKGIFFRNVSLAYRVLIRISITRHHQKTV